MNRGPAGGGSALNKAVAAFRAAKRALKSAKSESEKKALERECFHQAFVMACALDRLRDELARARSKPLRRSLEKQIGALANEITSGAKLAAIERNRHLLDFAREHIAASSELNIAETARQLPQIVERLGDRPRALTHRTKRNLITGKIGVKGKPGRKPRKA